MKAEYVELLILGLMLIAFVFSSTYLTSEGFEVSINYGEVYITEGGDFIFSKRIIGFPNVRKAVEILAKSKNNISKNVTIVFEYSGEIENSSESIFANGSLLLWNASFSPYEKKRLILVGDINLSKPRVYSYYVIPSKSNKTVKKIVIEEEKEPIVVIERKRKLPAEYGEKAREILEPSYEIKREVRIDFPTFLSFLLGVFFLAIVSTTTSLFYKPKKKERKRTPRIFIKTEYPEDFEMFKKEL